MEVEAEEEIKPMPTLEAMADESFKKEFLEAHNEYRKQHQAPELTYNDELCSAAQKWADHMLSIRTLGHSETDDGENVYYFSSSVSKPASGKAAVDSWYSEIKDYNFSTPGNQPGTGHFTQVVWKSSTELGVGLATDGKTVFVVGQYRPAGNMINAGYYEKNVLPKIE
ncbi:Golgi-associated plant pathogenesis-related protein 1 [Labeo rohita]|uniref:Golgi-associated plant pathogenesis-related protein 1 n=1 Tax=Labeo rohita TaxID=84645 RepID=A0ABQ8M2J7_LABRO|nr:Golgi-associated plant pathogenesis-related protein 1 [Labeo rohita]